jgi:hypothetical protein
MTTIYANSTTLRAIIPGVFTRSAAFYTADVFTPTPGGGTSSALTFSTNNPDPTLLSIAPTSVSAGTTASITLTGTNFATNATVELDGPVTSWTTLAQITVVSSTEILATIPGIHISQSGNYYLRVVNPTPGGGVSGSRALLVNPADVASVEFVGITTTTLTTGQADGFYVRFRDAFGNLTDTDRAFVRFANADGSSTGTIALRRSSRGVSTATTTIFTVDGVYTFSVDNVPTMLGNRTLTVQTGADFWTRFEFIQPQITAGGTLPTFRLTYKDRFGNVTDRGLGDVTLRHTLPSNGRSYTVPMTRISEGVYESVPFSYTTSGTYFVRVAGIPLGYISYISSTGTLVEGEAPSFRVNPAAPVADFRSVDGLLYSGDVQARFRVIFRDMYDNRINPGAIDGLYGDMTVRFSNTTSANIPNNGQELFSGSIPMRFIGNGVYEADTVRFFKAGSYTLSFDTIPTRAGLWAFHVRPRGAATVEIQNTRDTIRAGETQAWTLVFRDIHGNLTDATNALRYTKSGVPTSTSTIALQRVIIGVSEATVTPFTIAGSYTLSIAGISVANTLGGRQFVVTGNPIPVLTLLAPTTVYLDIAATLTLTGDGFIPASVVYVNGTPVPTTYRTSTSIEAAISRTFFTATGTANVWVQNPAPAGGTSVMLPLQVDNPIPVLTSIDPDRIVLTGGRTTLALTPFGKGSASTQSRLIAPLNTAQSPLAITGLEQVPNGLVAYPNAPNPFANTTTLRYSLSEAADDVQIEITDVQGNRKALLAQGKKAKGLHTAEWSVTSDMPSGTYTARIQATFAQRGNSASTTLRLTVIK